MPEWWWRHHWFGDGGSSTGNFALVPETIGQILTALKTKHKKEKNEKEKGHPTQLSSPSLPVIAGANVNFDPT